jgi:hypothetical protein
MKTRTATVRMRLKRFVTIAAFGDAGFSQVGLSAEQPTSKEA